ncbi:MAG: hypothetical protein AAGD32_13680 [Planctomycetota bacterium]
MSSINLGSLFFTIEGRSKMDAAIAESKRKIDEIRNYAAQPINIGGGGIGIPVPVRQGIPLHSGGTVGQRSVANTGTAGRISSIDLLNPSGRPMNSAAAAHRTPLLSGRAAVNSAAAVAMLNGRMVEPVMSSFARQATLPGGYAGGPSRVASVFTQGQVLDADARRRAMLSTGQQSRLGAGSPQRERIDAMNARRRLARGQTGSGAVDDPIKAATRRVTRSHDQVGQAGQQYARELNNASDRLRRQTGGGFGGGRGGGGGRIGAGYPDYDGWGDGPYGRRRRPVSLQASPGSTALAPRNMVPAVPRQGEPVNLRSGVTKESLGGFARRIAGTQVMSSSMFMLSMFGGYEAFGAVNAGRAARRTERTYGSADRRTAEAHLAAVDQVSGGILGTPLAFAMDPYLQSKGLTPEQIQAALESSDATDIQTDISNKVREMENEMRRRTVTDGLTGFSRRIADVADARAERSTEFGKLIEARREADATVATVAAEERNRTRDPRIRQQITSERLFLPTEANEDRKAQIRREIEAADRQADFNLKAEQRRIRERMSERLKAFSDGMANAQLDRIGGQAMNQASIYSSLADASAASRRGESFQAFRSKAQAERFALQNKQTQDAAAFGSSIEALPFNMKLAAAGSFGKYQEDQREQQKYDQTMQFGRQFVAPRIGSAFEAVGSFYGLSQAAGANNAILDAQLARDPMGARLAQIDAQRQQADLAIDASGMAGPLAYLAKRGNDTVFGKQAALTEQQFADRRRMIGLGLDSREAQFAARNDLRGVAAANIGFTALGEAMQLQQSGENELAARTLSIAKSQINDVTKAEYAPGAYDRNIASGAQRGNNAAQATERTNDLLQRIDATMRELLENVAGGAP